VLLRLAYLAVTNMFALLRLLPVSDREKDVEILVLRHQIAVLQRQLGTTRPRLLPSDRAFLAALLHRIPRDVGASRVPGNRVMVAYLDAGDKPGAAVRRGARRPGRGRRGVGEPPGRHPRHHDNQGRERGRNTRVHRRSTRQASRSSSPSG